MADPYRYFRVEAREILDQLQKLLLELEKGTAPPDAVKSMIRKQWGEIKDASGKIVAIQ